MLNRAACGRLEPIQSLESEQPAVPARDVLGGDLVDILLRFANTANTLAAHVHTLVKNVCVEILPHLLLSSHSRLHPLLCGG